MKKYWKVLLLTVVGILAIGLYYVQSANQSQAGETPKLERVSGDEAAVADVELEVISHQQGAYQSFLLTKDETKRAHGQSLIDGMFRPYSNLPMSDHVETYRSFMRGKHLYAHYYFEDEAQLIYVDAESSEQQPIAFDIAILDKKAEKQEKFEAQGLVEIPKSWIDVVGVSLVEEQIKVLTDVTTQTGQSSLVAYVIDPVKQTVVQETVLAEIEQHKYVSFYNERHEITNSPYYLYRFIDDDSILTDVHVYEMHSGKVEPLYIPENLTAYLDDAMVDGAYFYIPESSQKGVNLHTYDLKLAQWLEPTVISYPAQALEEPQQFLVKNNRLVSVTAVEAYHRLLVHDLASGELLYEGKIGDEADVNSDNFYIEQIHVKESK